MYIVKEKNTLYFKYETQRFYNDQKWVYEKLEDEGQVRLKKIFTFEEQDLAHKKRDPNQAVKFIISKKNSKGYFQIPKRILNINYDLYIHEEISISDKTFFTDHSSISLFKILDKFPVDSIYIGGSHPQNLSKDSFDEIIQNIPKKHEVQRYLLTRVESVLNNYIETGTKYKESFENYLNKKTTLRGKPLRPQIKKYEIKKYEVLLKKLRSMLENEHFYNEHEWQKEILEIILLLYPKYIKIFPNVPVKDIYNNKNRKLDFLLVDASGNIDIIEIKKPFESSIITKNQYRDNYIPLRELSGCVMQIEKYLFCLKCWGRNGEKNLKKRYKKELPNNFDVKIINPHGIVIMGREHNMNDDQLRDFEVVKRQYKNIVDIITYDELLRRLEFIISNFKKE